MVVFVAAIYTTYETKNEGQRKETLTKIVIETTNTRTFGRQRTSSPGLLLEYLDRSLADDLTRRVRVLCWVMIFPRKRTSAVRIKETWGKRCNILLFMASAHDRTRTEKPLPTVTLSVPGGEKYHWELTKAGYRYVYKNYRNKADWFLNTNDNTYVILENLRYMLANYDSNTPQYFRCGFKIRKKGHLSGSAGYVLSRAAVVNFVENGVTTLDQGYAVRDREMAVRLITMSMKQVDVLRRGRFQPFTDVLMQDNNQDDDTEFWDWSYVYSPRDSPNCSNEYIISFHYVGPGTMFELDYLIYQLRPYGIEYKVAKLPRLLANRTSEVY